MKNNLNLAHTSNVMKYPFFVFPINSKPLGFSYSDWTEAWWKWILKVPKSYNPLIDYTGENASRGQNQPDVFYLCQTNEQNDQIPVRKVNIFRSKFLFFPIINWLSVQGIDGMDDKSLIQLAKEKMDVVSNLEIIIDGVRLSKDLKKFRVQSRIFELNIDQNNVLDLPPGYTRMISDGYWLFLRPQGPLRELRSFGSCSSGATKIAVRYCFT